MPENNDRPNTPTTTTASENTTTTTTQKVEVEPVPTGDEASVNYPGGEASPNAPRRGEVVIDAGAETNVLGGDGGLADAEADQQASDQNREQGKQDGLRNAARERDEQATGRERREESQR